MLILRILLLSVLILQICYAYGSPSQGKIYSKNEAPHGYIPFENSFYKYHRVPQTWAKARQICDAEGGYLAIINSEDEANFLIQMMAKYPVDVLTDVRHKNNVLVGFHDYFEEGEFVTIDGKSLENSGYVYWAPGQPNNYGGNEQCGSLWRKGGLTDFPCATSSPFICEISSDTLCTIRDVENSNQ
ncbi:hemolymph lipopolysaccharide-binding protein-like [Chrysoperla carnea]|uniref:hemolymph lipopolysaccharide-binding protein-like n=1 Tax=Chrysoperla carnea TaxID=189513 RepID=UPI001D087267|nr:hemolymph lipopolysaccharide-binding protein-like [Chrysoperla carnea]